MKGKLLFLALALAIFFAGFAKPIFGKDRDGRSESKSNSETLRSNLPAKQYLLGTWVFYGLQELHPESGEVLGSYHAFTFYEFGNNQKIKIDDTLYEWDTKPESGIIDVGGIQFQLIKYRPGKMILKDGDQLYHFGKLESQD